MRVMSDRERSAALLSSPGGSLLLLMLNENQTPVEALVDPLVGLHAIAQAVGELSPWNGLGHDRIVRAVVEERDRHHDRLEALAYALVSQPGIEWMWAGVDLDNQLWLPQEAGWIDRSAFESARHGNDNSWSDPYAHEPRPLLSTSNRCGEFSAELVHLVGGMGDWVLEPPIPRRHVTIRPDARILEIQTPQDWHEFVFRYPASGDHRTNGDSGNQPWGRAQGLWVPGWRSAAADWDGVNISPWAYLTVNQMRVESDAGWTEPWAWEGPHTVWLDWVFDSVERLPPMLEDSLERGSRFWPLQALQFQEMNGWMVTSMADESSVDPQPMPDPGGSFQVGWQSFGEVDGESVGRVSLTNSHGLSLTVLSYGGIIQSLTVPDRYGDRANVVLGFNSLEEYVEKSPYFGAIVGRYANRIANGRFTLDGRQYQVPVNNGPNSLHGGLLGFDRRVWTTELERHPRTCSVSFRHTSHDGEQGYPGTVEVVVTYTVDTTANSFAIDYQAITDTPTVINLSNHSYFNLGGEGSGDILRHVMMLRASRYLPVDNSLIPTGEIAPVRGTPFDFTDAHIIGERIDTPGDDQLTIAGGYDHCWVFDKAGGADGDATWLARVVDPVSGRTMNVHTDQPGVQFYTGNFLDGSFAGAGGHVYQRRSGFCLETQHFPDSPNQPAFPSTVLRPGEVFRSRTDFSFDVLSNTGTTT